MKHNEKEIQRLAVELSPDKAEQKEIRILIKTCVENATILIQQQLIAFNFKFFERDKIQTKN